MQRPEVALRGLLEAVAHRGLVRFTGGHLFLLEPFRVAVATLAEDPLPALPAHRCEYLSGYWSSASSRTAYAAASDRLRRPSLERMLATWCSAVRLLM